MQSSSVVGGPQLVWTLVPISPLPAYSQMTLVEDKEDLPLMEAAGIVQLVRAFPDDLYDVEHHEIVSDVEGSELWEAPL
jgi:hypothetical protein